LVQPPPQISNACKELARLCQTPLLGIELTLGPPHVCGLSRAQHQCPISVSAVNHCSTNLPAQLYVNRPRRNS
jgi:hypothetical protein